MRSFAAGCFLAGLMVVLASPGVPAQDPAEMPNAFDIASFPMGGPMGPPGGGARR